MTGEDQIEGNLVEEGLLTGYFLNLCKIWQMGTSRIVKTNAKHRVSTSLDR